MLFLQPVLTSAMSVKLGAKWNKTKNEGEEM
jgi:uncharacterized protein (DUF736 family)